MPVSRDSVLWSYRLLLGREPESETVIEAAMLNQDIDHLRINFISSEEFRGKFARPLPAIPSIDRKDQARAYIGKDDLGIEVGAWFNPLTPRSEGYNCLSLDVYDTPELIRKATSDDNISPEDISRIQDVDLVGSVTELADLAKQKNLLGQVDYIISAHNFEHVPDPISFFQACERVLRPGGVLSMIIPDRRTCFDYFRPVSTTGHFLDAFFAKRNHPSAGQIFDHFATYSENRIAGSQRSGWSQIDSIVDVAMTTDLLSAMDIANSQFENQRNYIDAHCWVFTPATFRSIIYDLQCTKLINFSILEIIEPGSHEFFVHLKNATPEEAFHTAEDRIAHRTRLARDILQGM